MLLPHLFLFYRGLLPASAPPDDVGTTRGEHLGGLEPEPGAATCDDDNPAGHVLLKLVVSPLLRRLVPLVYDEAPDEGDARGHQFEEQKEHGGEKGFFSLHFVCSETADACMLV
jgi:hypothetical protein